MSEIELLNLVATQTYSSGYDLVQNTFKAIIQFLTTNGLHSFTTE